ncbi:MAG: hypothetical protein C4558_01875 [Dehalococcoidia bacterium]|nr:MAG: hypothetical protein C4558_01875 [Dehalococcoidia bacterium]
MATSSRWAPLSVALFATFILAGCSGGSARRPAGAEAGTVVATDLAFQPTEVRALLNQPLMIRLDNKGKLLHDWTVEKIAVTAVKEEGSAAHSMGGHGSGAGTMMPGAGSMPGGMMGTGSQAGQFALHVAADAGQVATIEFTPTEAGTYVFYCTVPGHREAGMEGKLVVG